MPEPERPRVTVSDPRVPGAVVVQGEEPAALPRTPRGRRETGRRWPALLVAVLVGFGASQLLEVQRDQREADRLGSVLDLRLRELPGGGVEQRDQRLRPTVVVRLELANRGPLPVALGDVTVEGSDLVGPDETLELGADEETQLRLEQAVTCPRGAPPRTPLTGSRVVLRARTATGPQEMRVPLPATLRSSLQDVLAAACGRVPDELALEVRPQTSLVRDGEASIALRFINRSARPVRVTALEPQLGLAIELRVGRGLPLALPLDLPASQFGTGAPDLLRVQAPLYTLAVRVRPEACGLDAGGLLADLRYQVQSEGGGPAGPEQVTPVGDELGVLDGLLRETCP